jgi:hypothetical protein
MAGKDLSSNMLLDNLEREDGARPVFLRRRAMSASWQSIQKMPWDVRAYLRFSILRLQLRHLKQSEQNAWSPVRIARSSILLPQLLQLYVQLLQISEPSPSSKRLASESSRVPQVLQRKQSICQRFPAVEGQSGPCCRFTDGTHRAQRLFPLRGSEDESVRVSLGLLR